MTELLDDKNGPPVSERLKDLRLALGLSQRAMARRFRVRHSAISQWESGKREVPGPVLALIEIHEKDLKENNVKRREKLKKIETSWLSRTLSTTVTAAVVSGKIAQQKFASILLDYDKSQKKEKLNRIAIARQLAEQLGSFKGISMKLGQMASYLDIGLPEEAKECFRELQQDSRPMDASVIEKVIEKELGNSHTEIFSEWDGEPIAAASIGQVHRAALKDNTEVVVKVQYPGISKAIHTDLKNSALVELFTALFYRGQTRGTLLRELRERLKEECDYLCEANNQTEFFSLYAEDKEIMIPKVFNEFTTKRVITSQYHEGDSFYNFIKEADQNDRNQAAKTIYRFAYGSIYKHHIFNCDPHPGNYLFKDGRVVFLDFGCVKRFRKCFIEIWQKLGKAVIDNRDSDIDKITKEMGLVPNAERFDFEYHRNMMKLIYKPIMQKNSFRFTREFVEKTWRMLVLENPNRFYMNFPSDWLFTNRLQWGLFSVLAMMQADIPCNELFEEYLE